MPGQINNRDTQSEAVQNIVGSTVKGSGNVSVTYDDADDEIRIDTTGLNQEQVEDAVSSLVAGGTNISVDYDDQNDTLTISSTDPRTDVSDNGSQLVGDVEDINFTGSAFASDDGDGTVTVEAIKSYPTQGDVPSLDEGQVVYVEDDNSLYLEDGT
jgi:hypothetical protein